MAGAPQPSFSRVRELPQWLLKQLLAITRLPMPKELTVPGLLPSIGGVIIVLLRSSPLKRVTIPCHKYRGGPKSRVLKCVLVSDEYTRARR